MLTAGLNQKLSLFQVDGKKNAKIQTIFIEKFPILAAHFTKMTGDEIIMGSRHKSFYVYDMHSGKMINVNPYAGKALNDEYAERSISTNFEISADNRLIAFVGSQGQIHLFSCKVNQKNKSFLPLTLNSSFRPFFPQQRVLRLDVFFVELNIFYKQ